MNALTEAFETRRQEIDAYLDFLVALDQQIQEGVPKLGGVTVTAQQQKILYAAVYLHLYNLIEATITRCVDAVSTVAALRWYPRDLSGHLRREWVRAAARTHVGMDYEKRLESALELCDVLVRVLPVPSWEIEKGTANWDDRQIESISSRIGLNLRISAAVLEGVKRPFRDERGPLGLVKCLRNDLAHGSLSFTECGEGATVANLRDLAQRTVQYLREVVAAFQTYIDGHEILAPERRPRTETPP